jgi:hypothetical protein
MAGRTPAGLAAVAAALLVAGCSWPTGRHRGDRTAVERLFAEFGERTAEENELLNRLGGDCNVTS